MVLLVKIIDKEWGQLTPNPCMCIRAWWWDKKIGKRGKWQ